MMKRYLFILIFLSPPLAVADAGSSRHEIVVKNLDENSSPCHVRFPASSIKCTNESCEFAAPKTSTLQNIQLYFSCIPVTSPTGFENFVDGGKIYSIQTPNAKGFISLFDEPPEEPGERMRELYFCLYGEAARFCGFAKTLRLQDAESADASRDIIKFIKTMNLTNGDGRK